MALVVPAAFAMTAGIFGLLNGIGGIFIGMRKCYNGYKNIGVFLDTGEVSLGSMRDPVMQVAVFINKGAIEIEEFSSIVQSCAELKEGFDGID